MPHISLAAERLWTIGGVPVSNALVTTWLVMGILVILAYISSRSLRLIPGPAQSIAEVLIGGLYDFFHSVTGPHIKKFFPLLASLFLFIITANWVGLLPGVGTIGFFREKEPVAAVHVTESAKAMPVPAAVGVAEKEVTPEKEFVPLFRGATADFNTTLALAIIAVVAIQYFGFTTLGFHYSTRFVNFKDPIYFVIGILEMVSELSKVISFAFRLFGNIFAGEVLLTVMAFLMPFLLPLPFITMELFVGFIQALVFSMLTAVFLNVAVSHGEEVHGKEVSAHG